MRLYGVTETFRAKISQNQMYFDHISILSSVKKNNSQTQDTSRQNIPDPSGSRPVRQNHSTT